MKSKELGGNTIKTLRRIYPNIIQSIWMNFILYTATCYQLGYWLQNRNESHSLKCKSLFKTVSLIVVREFVNRINENKGYEIQVMHFVHSTVLVWNSMPLFMCFFVCMAIKKGMVTGRLDITAFTYVWWTTKCVSKCITKCIRMAAKTLLAGYHRYGKIVVHW